MRARRAMVVALVAVLVGGLAGGWFAAEKLQSPAQVAARAEPPEPADVVAPVTVGALSELITARSQIARESASSVAVALGSAALNVVTAQGVPSGSELTSGAVALEVNGRPVIATTGAFPYYRDMVEGDTGPDVEQLQRFLQSRGLRTGGIGEFGAETARAVRQLYAGIGYEVTTREAPAEEEAATASGAQDSAAPAADAASGEAGTEQAGTEQAGTEQAAAPAPAAVPAPARQLVVVPRSELVVLGALPAVVGSTPAVGTVLTTESSVLTLGQGTVVARAQIAVTVLPVLSEGMSVTLTGPDGSTMSGTLGAIPAVTSGAEGSSPEVAVPVLTDAIDEAWLNANVLTTITVTAVAEQALRVPSRAVASRSSGAFVVQRRTPDGSFEEVEVRELGRLGGTSAVEPITPDALVEGDEVKVE